MSNALDELVGLDIEEVQAQFTAKGFLRPRYVMLRANDALDQRWYTTKDDPRRKPYVSVTTGLELSQHPEYGLKNWWMTTDPNEIFRRLKESSEYGTFMHEVFSKFMIDGVADLDKTADLARAEAARKGHSPEQWAGKIVKHLLAWAEFCHQHNVKPLAIEMVLKSEKLQAAGAIDLVCELDWGVTGFHGEVYAASNKEKAGQPKQTKKRVRVRAILDWKSGSNFYLSHGQQLVTYHMIWKENFGRRKNGKIDLLINWKPKDWRTNPSWETKEQNDAEREDRIARLFKDFHEQHDGPKPKLVTSGKLYLGKSTDGTYSYETIITRADKANAVEETIEEADADVHDSD